MFRTLRDFLFDLKMIFIYIVILAGIYLLSFVPLLFGFIFGAMAWLGLTIASRYLNKFLAGTAITVSKLTEAKRYMIVKLPEKYDVRFVESRGFKNVLWNIFLFNLLGSFMVVRYFGVPSTDINTFISGYLLAVFIASIIALVVTPIAVNVSAIETTRFRVFDLEKMLMTYPAYLFYRVIKAIFGFGNLAALLWIFLDSITVTGGDIVSGFNLFLVLALTTFSSVAFGSLIATIVARLVQISIVEDLMNAYDEALDPLSEEYSVFLEKLKEEGGVEEEAVAEMTVEEEEVEETGKSVIPPEAGEEVRGGEETGEE